MRQTILLGMHSDEENIEGIVIQSLEANGIATSVIRKYTKLAVRGEIGQNKEINVLLIIRDLEMAHPYTPTELEELTEIREDLKIILILPTKFKGTSYMEQLYFKGIYNAIFDEDSSFDKIAQLIKNTRKKKLAKVYYGIINELGNEQTDKDQISINEQYKALVPFLLNKKNGDLIEKLHHISNMLSSTELKELLNSLPNELKVKVKGMEGFQEYIDDSLLDEETEDVRKNSKIKNFIGNLGYLEPKSLFIKMNIIMKNNIKVPKLPEKKSKSVRIKKEQLDNLVEVECFKPILDSVSELIEPTEFMNPSSLIDETIYSGSIDEILSKEINEKDEHVKPKKQKIKSKQKQKPLQFPLTISICSLAEGVGCTHLTEAMANYIKHIKKWKICIVEYAKSNICINGIERYALEDFYNIYNEYEVIIIDVGVVAAGKKNEISISPIKIMCCRLDIEYQKALAAFIENETNTKWKYFFKDVPEKKEKEVADLMEDFEYWCVPVFDATDKSFDKGISEIFEKVIYGEKL